MKTMLFSNIGIELTKNELKSISGNGGDICCEWCPDGSCLDWTSPNVPCPFRANDCGHGGGF